jgi:hypothetical protein
MLDRILYVVDKSDMPRHNTIKMLQNSKEISHSGVVFIQHNELNEHFEASKMALFII